MVPDNMLFVGIFDSYQHNAGIYFSFYIHKSGQPIEGYPK